jgi:hypothetical protein
LGVMPANLLGAIGRCVVGNDEFKVMERLRQNAFNGASNIGLAIKDRKSNGEKGRMAAHMRFSIFYRQPAPTTQAVILQAPHQRTEAVTLAAILASSCDDCPAFRPQPFRRTLPVFIRTL